MSNHTQPGALGASSPSASGRARLSINPPKERVTTLVAKGMLIDGSVQGAEGVMVRGEVRGDILISDKAPAGTGTVFVDDSGVVKGLICARRVVVMGRVDGVVIALESLELAGKGRINGPVYCLELAGQKDGSITGEIHRIRPGENPLMRVQESRWG